MDRVIVIKPITFNKKIYPIGHIFNIIGNDSMRGYDLRDDDGNTIYETRMISDHYKIFTIDKERDKKIDQILSKD